MKNVPSKHWRAQSARVKVPCSELKSKKAIPIALLDRFETAKNAT